MRVISHRGNISGPQPAKENSPDFIDTAITLGFDVEVDVRSIEGEMYLGHDEPDHRIDWQWLIDRKDRLWIHCKNLEAASMFHDGLRCFCSISDPYCFMTEGYLWLNDVEIEPKDNCIVPLLGVDDLENYKFMGKPHAICTDYPFFLHNGCR